MRDICAFLLRFYENDPAAIMRILSARDREDREELRGMLTELAEEAAQMAASLTDPSRTVPPRTPVPPIKKIGRQNRAAMTGRSSGGHTAQASPDGFTFTKA